MKSSVINNDCLDGLKLLDDNSVDAVITDPPYGLSFMGKDWDKALPDIDVFRECLRVLKPGRFACVMSAPRSDLQSRMSILLEDAGFNIGFTPLYWTYASGFPKAMNMSKAIDKRLGVKPNKEEYEHPNRKNRTHNYSTGFQEGRANEGKHLRDIPTSDLAKKYDGAFAGFQPKPAVEPILIAMKPLTEKSYINQVLVDGGGVTWLDNVRIPYESGGSSASNPLERINNGCKIEHGSDDNATSYKLKKEKGQMNINNNGRFPANLIVSDDVLNNGQNTNSKQNRKSDNRINNGNSIFLDGERNPNNSYSDTGSFSRYFDLDAWWSKQLENLPENIQKTFPYLIVPKASKSEKNKGCEELEPSFVTNQNKYYENDYRKGDGEKTVQPTKNNHPTVKPIKLMSYLIQLTTQPGDTVLDPYSGSGTTLIGAKINNRDYIGFELEEDYYNISLARLGAFDMAESVLV